ncbi:ferric reductase NAD binding domain-containing protein [Cytidiella melzeri]|nr:ferric reductase NAD binding domain-containing protein [Cytidiella melzeri]
MISLTNIPSALISATRIAAFRLRIPSINLSVLEAILTAIYLMALLIWQFSNTEDLNITYYSDRSGHIAACQIPLIVALSMKNNVIGYLTGVSHEKLHILHRTISRSVFVIICVHGFSRHVQMVAFGWTRMGLACGIIYAIMMIMSFSPIRRRCFEIFYLIHVVLAFAFILLAYFHTAASNFGYYVWPAFVVWGFDRVCRYLRYLIFADFQSPLNPSNQATLELLASDTIRITARRGRNIPITWSAGQHMFLAMPTLGPIESHPFTISTIADDDHAADTASNKEHKGKEMVWIIRTRDGFTRRMKEYVIGMDGKCQVPVFMHGPYGAPTDITPYNTCVFIAGGSGITYTLPRMRELLIQVSKSQACARRVVFIWVIRHPSHLEWLSSEITKALSTASRVSGLSLTIQIYVTALAASSSRTSEDTEKDAIEPATPDSDERLAAFCQMDGVEMKYGRPNVEDVLESAVRSSDGPISVDVSGPRALLQDVRTSLSRGFASPISVLRGVPSVQLNVETFSM